VLWYKPRRETIKMREEKEESEQDVVLVSTAREGF